MRFVVAVLDTMWGGTSKISPQFFVINQNNVSGKRLYSLLQPTDRLLVTNACKEVAECASDHGTPDPIWLSLNLRRIQMIRSIDVLLICGKIAQQTFDQITFKVPNAKVLRIPHPAARTMWTPEYVEQVREQIQGKAQTR